MHEPGGMHLWDVAEAEDQAAQAFAATLEWVTGEVAMRWADPLPPAAGPGGRPVAHLPVFDARYPVSRRGVDPDPRWGPAQFEWSFGVSELRDDHLGEVAFAAGAVVARGEGQTLFDDPRWLPERRAEGFERLHNMRLGAEQLVRWLDMDRVLMAGEPAEQGELVADWVVSTFEGLAGNPPPQGAA